MKLQYNIVEYNIKELNEKIKLYDEACNCNAMERAAKIMESINETLVALRGSIRKGHWVSKELCILNGPPYPEPIIFLIPFNKIY